MSYNRNPNSADEVRPMSLAMIGKYGDGNGYGNGNGNGNGNDEER